MFLSSLILLILNLADSQNGSLFDIHFWFHVFRLISFALNALAILQLLPQLPPTSSYFFLLLPTTSLLLILLPPSPVSLRSILNPYHHSSPHSILFSWISPRSMRHPQAALFLSSSSSTSSPERYETGSLFSRQIPHLPVPLSPPPASGSLILFRMIDYVRLVEHCRQP